jgi:hypothetical protein
MKNKAIWLSLITSTCILAWTNAADVSGGSGKNFFPQIVSDGDEGAVFDKIMINDIIIDSVLKEYYKPQTNPFGVPANMRSRFAGCA